MQSLIVHSYRRCPFAIRVRMVLEEKNLPYTVREEKLSDLSPELLSLHPEGRVPLLIHETIREVGPNRQVIYQSSVITEYLEEAFPEVHLMPVAPIERARVRLWTYWCDQIFKPDLDFYKYELSKISDGDRIALLSRIHEHLSKWNSALTSHPYLLGEEMTLADIHLFPFARQFMAIKPSHNEGLIKMDQYRSFGVWLDRMVGRPAFQRAMER